MPQSLPQYIMHPNQQYQHQPHQPMENYAHYQMPEGQIPQSNPTSIPQNPQMIQHPPMEGHYGSPGKGHTFFYN